MRSLASPVGTCALAAAIAAAFVPPARADLGKVPSLGQPAGVTAAAASGVEVGAGVRRVDAATVVVQLRLTGVQAPRGATISYSLSGPGRILQQDDAELPSGAVALRQVTVQVEPGQPSYLNVFTRQRGRSGVVSVPLESQAQQQPKPAPAGVPSSGTGGQPLVVLPGQLR